MPAQVHFLVFFGFLAAKLARVTNFGVQSGFINSFVMQDYKSLCVAVMICATMVHPKLDFYILHPVTLKSRSNRG